MLLECRRDLLERASLRDRDYLSPRDHCLFDRGLGKLEDLVDKPSLFFVQMSALLRNADQLPYLIFGVYRSMFGVGMKSEDPDRFCTRPIQRVDQRLEDGVEDLHRQSSSHRDSFGELQAEQFRGLFAENYVQTGDDDECDTV